MNNLTTDYVKNYRRKLKITKLYLSSDVNPQVLIHPRQLKVKPNFALICLFIS